MARIINRIRRPRMFFFVALGLVIAVAGWLGSAFARPFIKAGDMARENERLERQTMEAEIEQQELRKRQAILKTNSGMEREARRLGYVRSNEVPLIIPEESTRP